MLLSTLIIITSIIYLLLLVIIIIIIYLLFFVLNLTILAYLICGMIYLLDYLMHPHIFLFRKTCEERQQH